MSLLTPRELIDLETALWEPRFRGMPLGAMLAPLFLVNFYLEKGSRGLLETFRARVRRALRPWQPLPRPDGFNPEHAGRALITWFDATARGRELILPVIEELAPEGPVVLCRTSAMVADLPDGCLGLDLDRVRGCDRARWRADLRAAWGPWKRTVRREARRFGLPRAAVEDLHEGAVVQTRLAAAYQRMLDELQPAGVLTEYDRGAIWAPLLTVARECGVPSMTMVHGTLGDEGFAFVPLIADRVACWGAMQRRAFRAAGVADERIVLAGCPRLTRDLPAPRAGRDKLNLPAEESVAMLATSPYPAAQRLRLVEQFCIACAAAEGWRGVVRLHPNDSIGLYGELRARFRGVEWSEYDRCTLDEAIAASDLVVVYSSGVGGDALIKRRPVAVLDVIDFPFAHGQDLLDAGCPRLHSARELTDLLGTLGSESAGEAELLDVAERFAEEFCAYYGRDAARRIAELFRSALHETEAREERA